MRTSQRTATPKASWCARLARHGLPLLRGTRGAFVRPIPHIPQPFQRSVSISSGLGSRPTRNVILLVEKRCQALAWDSRRRTIVRSDMELAPPVPSFSHAGHPFASSSRRSASPSVSTSRSLDAERSRISRRSFRMLTARSKARSMIMWISASIASAVCSP